MLADLRPNTRVLADMEATVGSDARVTAMAGAVTVEFRRRRVLIEAAVDARAELAEIDDPAVRHELERRHASLLAAHGMEHLDMSQIRSGTRQVTQEIGRSLYERGVAGVAFGSNHDGQPCYALFEGRAWLTVDERAELVELAPDLEILAQVCQEWDLRIER